jgi:hypothetical protein
MKEHTKCIFNRSDFIARNNVACVDVIGTGITFPRPSNVNQTVAGPCWLQLCVALESSGIKLSEYMYVKDADTVMKCLFKVIFVIAILGLNV